VQAGFSNAGPALRVVHVAVAAGGPSVGQRCRASRQPDGPTRSQGGIPDDVLFSKEARDYGQIEAKIILIDGPRLAALMVDYDVGVATVYTPSAVCVMDLC
jgi:hypothetical protein